MTKKEQENIKTWQIYTLSIRVQGWLSQQRHNAGNGGNNAADGTDVRTEPHKTLTPDTASIPATVDEDTAPMGYLKAIAGLLKQALFHKKGEHFVLVRYSGLHTGLT